jgi:hypothetical protein
LVLSNQFSKIGSVVSKIERIYENLNGVLRSNNIDLQLRPIIRILDISREQKEALIPLAERRLLELLDNSIERVNAILSSLSEIEEEVRRRKILNNLRRLRLNWNRIFEIARELNIDISRDYQVLIDMIDSAIS